MRVARAVSAAGLVVLAFAATGCGSGSDGVGATGTVSQVPDPTSIVHTAAEAAKSVAGLSFTAKLSGSAGTGADASPVDLSAHGRYGSGPSGGLLVVVDHVAGEDTDSTDSVEQRVVGGDVYMRATPEGSAKSGRWVKVAAQDAAADGPDSDGFLGIGTPNGDPLAQVQALAAARDVTAVGTEAVDGVATTRYAGDLVFTELVANTAITQAVRDEMTEMFATVEAPRLHFDVWLDGQNRARRLVMSMPGSAGSVSLRMTFGDVGKKVSVPAPVLGAPASPAATDLGALGAGDPDLAGQYLTGALGADQNFAGADEPGAGPFLSALDTPIG